MHGAGDSPGPTYLVVEADVMQGDKLVAKRKARSLSCSACRYQFELISGAASAASNFSVRAIARFKE